MNHDFFNYLKAQRKRNDAIGDLSKDVISDERITKLKRKYKEIRGEYVSRLGPIGMYLRLSGKNACSGAVNALVDAIAEYSLQRKDIVHLFYHWILIDESIFNYDDIWDENCPIPTALHYFVEQEIINVDALFETFSKENRNREDFEKKFNIFTESLVKEGY
jgi:uncharacterized protein YozE (UPF0346 family)